MPDPLSIHQPLVLLLDDNPSDLELHLQSFLRMGLRADYCCFTAPLNALAYLQSSTDRNRLPSLMIVDLDMPGMNGFEVLKTLKKKKLKQFPVVIVSSSIEPTNNETALQLGADAYYEKPIRFTDSKYLFAQLAQEFISIPGQLGP